MQGKRTSSFVSASKSFKRKRLLPRLEKRKRDLSTDLAKFEKLIVKLNAYKDQLLAKLDARRAGEAVKADELAEAKAARAALQSQLDNQELKPADVERIKRKRRTCALPRMP